MQKNEMELNLHYVNVIIPAFNEEDAIAQVIKEIPDEVSDIIVVDNGSTDATYNIAKAAGATVLKEWKKGYGHACLRGINHCNNKKHPPGIIVFLDGDLSDHPAEMKRLIQPISQDKADLVIGARIKELREKGSMTFPQKLGNTLATRLMKMIFPGSPFTDLGPFRVIKLNQLNALNMKDKTYGWTVEMQLKVLKKNMTYTEVEMNYRNRIGTSKVSGTVKGAVMAGVKILGWIFKYSFK